MSETTQVPMDCCQSCGMPFDEGHTELRSPEDPQYCVYCFANGQFTMPDATAADMVNIGVPLLAPVMGDDGARQYLERFIPTLARWH